MSEPRMTLDEFRARRATFTRVVGVAPVETEERIEAEAATGITALEVLLAWAVDE